MPNAPRVHIVVTSRSSTVKETTALQAIEVADIKFFEATELFRPCDKIQDPEPDVKTEVGQIMKELGCLALAIALAGSYVFVTPQLRKKLIHHTGGAPEV